MLADDLGMAVRPLRPRDPRRYLLAGFIAALLTWLGLIYWIGAKSGADLTPVANLLSYGIGFLFSAYVGMHIYFFTTAQSQDRQFRQEYTTKHVDEIYAPLYDELAKTVRELEDYGSPWRLEVWQQKKGTHFAFFVQDGLRAELDQLEGFLSGELSDARSKGYDAGGAAAVRAIQSIYGERLAGDKYVSMQSYISGAPEFLYDPLTRTPIPNVRSNIRGTLGNIDGTLLTEKELDDLFAKIKLALETLPEVTRFRSLREKAISMAVPIREALKDRVLRPYELRT
jgi:hypothetical protein